MYELSCSSTAKKSDGTAFPLSLHAKSPPPSQSRSRCGIQMVKVFTVMFHRSHKATRVRKLALSLASGQPASALKCRSDLLTLKLVFTPQRKKHKKSSCSPVVPRSHATALTVIVWSESCRTQHCGLAWTVERGRGLQLRRLNSVDLKRGVV